MTRLAILGYIAAFQALGGIAGLVDPDATSVWMRASFLVLAIGYFGELAILGLPNRVRRT